MPYPSDEEVIDIDEIDGNAWNQHPDETDKAYRAFQAFKDIGRDRNKLQAYLNCYGKSRSEVKDNKAPSHIYEWAKKFQWDERAKEWDKHIDEKKEEKYKGEMLDYYEDVINYAQNSSTHLLEALNARFEGKNPGQKAEMVFGDDSMDLEGFARTFQQLNNIASKAFGTFTEDEDDEEADATLKIIEEAVKDD